MEVDASDTGIGVVLSQRSEEDQQVHPVAFLSRRFTPAERNYDMENRELLAVHAALEEWRHWLEGARLEARLHAHSLACSHVRVPSPPHEPDLTASSSRFPRLPHGFTPVQRSPRQPRSTAPSLSAVILRLPRLVVSSPRPQGKPRVSVPALHRSRLPSCEPPSIKSPSGLVYFPSVSVWLFGSVLWYIPGRQVFPISPFAFLIHNILESPNVIFGKLPRHRLEIH